MAEIWDRLAVRLANADTLLLDYSAYVSAPDSFLVDTEKKAKDRR